MKLGFSSDANAYRITLSDPPLHILDIALLEELRETLGRVANDRHALIIDALIIDATGEKAFSAGASVQDGDRVAVAVAGSSCEVSRVLARKLVPRSGCPAPAEATLPDVIDATLHASLPTPKHGTTTFSAKSSPSAMLLHFVARAPMLPI